METSLKVTLAEFAIEGQIAFNGTFDGGIATVNFTSVNILVCFITFRISQKVLRSSDAGYTT